MSIKNQRCSLDTKSPDEFARARDTVRAAWEKFCMSSHLHEFGSYIMPPHEFDRVRGELKATWDREVHSLFDLVMQIYQDNPGIVYGDAVDLMRARPELDAWHKDLAKKMMYQTGHGGLAKPTKKLLREIEFETVVREEGDSDLECIPIGTASLHMDTELFSMDWDVPPMGGEDAVALAHSHTLGAAFLIMLTNIEWGDAPGGYMTVGNDHSSRVYRHYGRKASALPERS